jgi:hypothetical protein
MDHMLANYDHAADKINGIATSSGVDGNGSIYTGLATPINEGGIDSWDSTRVKADGQGFTASLRAPGSERRSSNASSIGVKRGREGSPGTTNGDAAPRNGLVNEETISKRPRVEEDAGLRAEKTAMYDTKYIAKDVERDTTLAAVKSVKADEGEVSEEGEVEE